MTTFATNDIDEQILAALNQIFHYELQEQVLGDPLALRTLKQSDLQDDPTLTAPYLTYKPYGSELEGMRLMDHHEEKIYGCAEIGGPVRYLYTYECTYGTPQTSTRELARAAIAGLQGRIVQCLIKYMDLAGVLAPGALESADQTQVLEGQNTRLVTKAGYRIYGGEQTFYGKGKINWVYPVSWNVQSRFYTGY